MKKGIAVFAAFMVFALASCGKSPGISTGSTASSESAGPDDISEVKNYLKENWDKYNIDGSTSMIPLHQSLSDVFSRQKTEITHSKTVDAFEKFIAGENDILLGVTYSDDLLNKAKNSGVDLVSMEITREGFVFLVNSSNPVKNLTTQQLRDIYSGKITDWKDVGGSSGSIVAYQRNDDSGSQIRMKKFMGDLKLMEKLYVADGMGELVLNIANFETAYDDNEIKHAIGYNMYTFTEKQYSNGSVELLSVDGVKPSDDTIFDETYPLLIYNYIYCDKNNAEAKQFADNLYRYLMSEEGQKLTSDSGYINLNKKYDRNKDTYFHEYWGLNFYNEEKGEFYDVDEAGKLLIYKNFPDFVLREHPKYKDNDDVRRFLTMLFDSGAISSGFYVNEDEGLIRISGMWFDASFDPDDLFNIRYDGKYYRDLEYYISQNKFVLSSFDGNYEDIGNLSDFPVDDIAGSDIHLIWEDLKNIYLKTRASNMSQTFEELEYFQLKG